MKLKDRVYREDSTKLGTVLQTSADGDADVFEGETVDVRWDATRKTERLAVEDLDRVETIHNKPGHRADAGVTLQQIGLGALMSCGYQPKTLVRDNDNGMIKFKVSGRYWLTVKLMGNDTYSIERARLVKTDYVIEAQETHIYCDQLAAAVIRLGDV